MYRQDSTLIVWLFLLVPWGLLLVCSIGVYVDAKGIGARKGLLSGFLDMGPFGWAACTFLLWIVAFPLYLVQRPKIKAAASVRHAHGYAASPGFQQPGWTQPAQQPWGGWNPPSRNPPPVGPPAGWYEDPERPNYNRWWDGHRWTEHRTQKPY